MASSVNNRHRSHLDLSSDDMEFPEFPEVSISTRRPAEEQIGGVEKLLRPLFEESTATRRRAHEEIGSKSKRFRSDGIEELTSK